MRPKPGIIYKMKISCARSLPGHSNMLKHVNMCGNKFKYKAAAGSYTNMECIECGWDFLTVTDTFGLRYNEIRPIMEVKDPNALFNKYKRDVKHCDFRRK